MTLPYPGKGSDPTVPLLAQARQGDRSALGQLLAGFRDYLLAVARRELDPALRAKLAPSDLVQDTFISAQQAIDRFEGSSEAELRTWLAQILRHRCLDLTDAHLGTAKRDVRREVAIDGRGSSLGVAFEATGQPSPSQCAMAGERARRLLATIDGLPPAMRDVVRLRNWEALTFDEIGRRTGRGGDAARKLFARAVAELAVRLGAGDDNARDHTAAQ